MVVKKDDNLIFISKLRINYKSEFIATAQSFIENLATIAGANVKEIYHLNVAVEESLVYLIDKYIDNNINEYIELCFKLLKTNIIQIEIENIGPPIHENRIPQFDIHDNNTIDGLWYQMAKNVVDKFNFINKKNNGWQIFIEKNIQKIIFKNNNIDLIQSDKKMAPFTTRVAKPEDAEALVDLAYYTYRYSNGIPEFYDVEILKYHIKEEKSHIIIVENKDKIIGATSIKFSEFNPKSAELSSTMVNPDYRKSSAVLRLFRVLNQYHKENPRNLEFFETFLVTTHTLSQRGVAKIHNGYKPFSISLGMIPRPDYIDIKDKNDDRESLLNSYHLNDQLQIKKIFVSPNNQEIINDIINNAGNELILSTKSEDPVDSISQISNFRIDTIKSAIVNIESFGIDWFTDLRKEIYNLTMSGIKTIIVSIKSDKPLPNDMENKLSNLNLIFTGLSLQSLQDIRLSYMLITEPVDFDSIKLDDPIAKKLLQHIKNRYEFVLSKGINSQNN